MKEPNAQELAKKIEYIKWLQNKLLDNLNQVQKELKSDNKSWVCPSCHRARYHQYRIILRQELLDIENYIYGRYY